MHRPSLLRASVAGGLVLTGVAAPSGDVASASARADASVMKRCVNAERARLGIRALRTSATLVRAARMHAREMASGRAPFDHTDAGGRGPRERVQVSGGGFRTVGENIALGQRSGAAACRAWRASTGHYGNWTFRRYRAIGTATAAGPHGRMYVQVFGAR